MKLIIIILVDNNNNNNSGGGGDGCRLLRMKAGCSACRPSS
jgi:hypothetical protein